MIKNRHDVFEVRLKVNLESIDDRICLYLCCVSVFFVLYPSGIIWDL